jgi:solute carrier family 35 protein C2
VPSFPARPIANLLRSILRRAGVVPMSIAGIAKEVTTISVSAIVFGDTLTPLNVVGVGITVCGKSLATHR